MELNYSEDRKDIYSRLDDMKDKIKELDKFFHGIEKNCNSSIVKIKDGFSKDGKDETVRIKKDLLEIIKIMDADRKAEMTRMREESKIMEASQNNLIEMIRELTRTYQIELVRLGTKFTIAVGIFTIVLTALIEVFITKIFVHI